MDRAIIGTAALEDRNFLDSAMEKYKEKIIISVDFDSKGIIYTRGWQQGTPYSIEEFLPLLKHSGINEIIITNITKDGTLSGPDTRLIRKVLDVSGLDLIIAGGITCIEDIKKLKKLESRGVTGVIIGKALYEEKISLIEAIDAGR
jgi:phosphoribosylformimino-5-aminoimidazole carboxamide ribotide isomerase